MKQKDYSRLLIHERPLQLIPSLVLLVGIERAIILQQIHYLTSDVSFGQVLDDGFRYVWKTAQQFHDEYFPFWQPDTIRKHLRSLELLRLVISRQENAKDWDRTKFYRVDEEFLRELDRQPLETARQYLGLDTEPASKRRVKAAA